jgi:hypothetical protein
VSELKLFNFKVRGEDPLDAGPPLYGNFLAVSQVGTEVQFEFIFVDLNQVASVIEMLKATDVTVVKELEGKTVVKVVMPGASFVQLREQFERVFSALKGVLPTVQGVEDEQRSKSTNLG